MLDRSHLSHSVMVSVGTSVRGVRELHFANPVVKINGKYYRETLLKEELLPDRRNISEYFIFLQDNVQTHRAKETLIFFRMKHQLSSSGRLTVRI